MRHTARKRFGQHFLIDQGVIGQIVEIISPHNSDLMVEIGPGMGAMTAPLLEYVQRLCVVELDKDLVERLQKNQQLWVISADVLNVDFAKIANECAEKLCKPKSNEGTLRVIGNLPYNISTPILFHLLNFVPHIKDQHFMLQKEVVQRMVAPPSSANYGRLSVMLQWRYEMSSVLDVEPDAFDPPPRVKSAIVRMLPRANSQKVNFEIFQNVVQIAFSQRRKLLRNTLGRWLEEQSFSGEFDLKRRAEEVSVDEFVMLSQSLSHISTSAATQEVL